MESTKISITNKEEPTSREVFMLSEDVKTLDVILTHWGFPDDNGAWSRIKTALAELGTTPNIGGPKLPDIEESMEKFAEVTTLVKEVTHVPSFVAGARAYHEFLVRQHRASA